MQVHLMENVYLGNDVTRAQDAHNILNGSYYYLSADEPPHSTGWLGSADNNGTLYHGAFESQMAALEAIAAKRQVPVADLRVIAASVVSAKTLNGKVYPYNQNETVDFSSSYADLSKVTIETSDADVMVLANDIKNAAALAKVHLLDNPYIYLLTYRDTL